MDESCAENLNPEKHVAHLRHLPPKQAAGNQCLLGALWDRWSRCRGSCAWQWEVTYPRRCTLSNAASAFWSASGSVCSYFCVVMI